MAKLGLLMAIVALLAGPATAQPVATRISIVAAENFYGDVARQLAGSQRRASPASFSNPDQDPHLFEASPSAARLLSAADDRHLQWRRL